MVDMYVMFKFCVMNVCILLGGFILCLDLKIFLIIIGKDVRFGAKENVN